jgi:hypothetical protein
MYRMMNKIGTTIKVIIWAGLSSIKGSDLSGWGKSCGICASEFGPVTNRSKKTGIVKAVNNCEVCFFMIFDISVGPIIFELSALSILLNWIKLLASVARELIPSLLKEMVKCYLSN